jgi:2-polyprenyl-6-methoxyphenol hydroxylase-like FAD-dependent oxidoreductase
LKHVEIAGAGLAGLATAASFARNGWSVRVHERGDELREIGAGIFLWENALRVLEAIGAFEEATHGGEVNEYWEFRDERQRLLQSGWMMNGSRLITVLRSRLHQALARAASEAGAEIVTNSSILGATPAGELIRADGRRFAADVIVGADGYNSVVRQTLDLTKSVRDLEDGCGRYLIDRRDGDPERRCLEYWNGARRVGIVPVTSSQIYVYLCCPTADGAARAGASDPKVWIDAFPALRGLLERLQLNGRWAPFFDVTCTRWSRGNAVVVGDAAHAMSPNLGQGACVAMQSGYSLSRALTNATNIPAALEQWEVRQRPVVDATQRFSRLYGRIGTRWPRPLLSLRSALVWGIGRSATLQRHINVAAHSDVTDARP